MNALKSNPSKSIKPIKYLLGKVAETSPTDQESQQSPQPDPRLHDLGLDHRRSVLERMSFRLREDFRLAMIFLFAGITLLTILPFSVFRFVSGDWLIALLDLGFLSVIVASFLIAWQSGRTELAGNLIAAAAITGVGAVVVVFGQSAMWVLPAMVGSFLLATSWVAAILSAGLIVMVAGHDPAFTGSTEHWIFVAASIQTALFSLIFSLRSNQRRVSLAFMAETDSLTGLGNRRALRQDLTSLVDHNRRRNANLAVAMMDIDHFKRVNDEFGHDVGDRVLEDLARIVKEETRETDRGYRFGGEEFVLILQDIDAPGLESALNGLMERIHDCLTSPGGPVTVSIGATRVSSADSAHACLQRADQAMYRAKSNGRDRLEIA